MIPLRDENLSGTVPVVTYGLIVACVIVFAIEAFQGPRLDQMLTKYGAIPAHYTSPKALGIPLVEGLILPLFASMFLHGGLLHLAGNMWYLWIFGDNVEDRLGHLRFFFFYIACGGVAALTHVALSPRSTVPVVGASGAIAGVLGAYAMSFPRARVLTLIPFLWFYWEIVPIPAFLVLGFWFLLQFANGALDLNAASATSGGVAWWAHVGGFLAGLLLLVMLPKRRRRLRHAVYARPGVTFRP